VSPAQLFRGVVTQAAEQLGGPDDIGEEDDYDARRGPPGDFHAAQDATTAASRASARACPQGLCPAGLDHSSDEAIGLVTLRSGSEVEFDAMVMAW